jgi:hypothetical protein
MARMISRIASASARILAYDVGSRVARALRAAGGEVSGQSAESTGKAQATRADVLMARRSCKTG